MPRNMDIVPRADEPAESPPPQRSEQSESGERDPQQDRLDTLLVRVQFATILEGNERKRELQDIAREYAVALLEQMAGEDPAFASELREKEILDPEDRATMDERFLATTAEALAGSFSERVLTIVESKDPEATAA